MHHKDFDTWNNLKKKVDTKARVQANSRDIWWASLGLNVGSEQDGKGDGYERPVIVVTKLSPNMYYVIPLSTKCKSSTMHIPFSHETVDGYALLDQMKALDAKRFIRKVGYVDKERFAEIISKLKSIF